MLKTIYASIYSPTIINLYLGLAFLIFFIWSIVWVYHDAKARGRSGCLFAILVFFTWPVGLPLWLFFRIESFWIKAGLLVGGGPLWLYTTPTSYRACSQPKFHKCLPEMLR